MLGDLGVGKTSLLRKLKTNAFDPHLSPSLTFDYFSITYEKLGEDVIVQFWDTAGQERFDNITKSYYHSADGVAIVVSAESTSE